MEKTDPRITEIQFVNLVTALAASAMQQLGKLVHPLTGKSEANLEGARATIDLLVMLREKTKGNLNADETQLLNSTISNCQLNYVDEVAKKGKSPAAEQDAKQAPPSASNPADQKGD